MNPSPVTLPVDAHPTSQGNRHLPQLGRWLFVARFTWLLLFLITVGIFIAALWGKYTRWSDPYPCDKLFLTSQTICLENQRALAQLGLSYEFYAVFFPIELSIEVVPWILASMFVFSKRSQDLFGILFSLMLVVSGTLMLDEGIPREILFHFPALDMFINVLDFTGSALLIVWYLFPDGHFVLPWTRWFAIGWISIELLNTIFHRKFPLDPYTWIEPLPTIIILSFVASILFSLIFRFRYIANGIQRQQIKWVVASGSFFAIMYMSQYLILPFMKPGILVAIYNLTYFPIRFVSGAMVAVGLGFSILRYRLWDIDSIVNRTLVYSGLTVLVVAIYMLIVGLLSIVIQERSNLFISILATGLVAVLVQPLRDRLQRGVNRLMYGERHDPVSVLSRLGKRLEGTLAPNAVLPSLVETVALTLKLPYVAIETRDRRFEPQPTDDPTSINASTYTVAYGEPDPDVLRLPLIYQSETIGQLLVAPRAPGEPLSPMDRHLLENIAHQAGTAVHAVNLTTDLQRSRQRLVTTREEERRRLRRDLHDGLGPNLASQGLKLAAVRQLIENDPDAAASLLDQVMKQNKSTIKEVRRLVYGLCPPALDELGLVEAIRDHVAGMDGRSTLQIEIFEPEGGLPAFSAAVEVAAYRIVLEAVTNVIRHAHAQHCGIRFSIAQKDSDPALQIEIQDDGVGLSNTRRAGVGTRSMRERAEELGGTCVLESMLHVGTRVWVKIPLIEN